jgi:hypothetical protein
VGRAGLAPRGPCCSSPMWAWLASAHLFMRVLSLVWFLYKFHHWTSEFHHWTKFKIEFHDRVIELRHLTLNSASGVLTSATKLLNPLLDYRILPHDIDFHHWGQRVPCVGNLVCGERERPGWLQLVASAKWHAPLASFVCGRHRQYILQCAKRCTTGPV